jgi:hypothetical protein
VTTVLIFVAGAVLFGVLVFIFIDREALGWERRPEAPAARTNSPYRSPAYASGAARDEPAPLSTGQLLLALFVIALALLAGYWFGSTTLSRAWALNMAHRSGSLPAVTGEVVSVDVVRVRGNRGSTAGWRPAIVYRYTVDAREYTSTVWRSSPSYVRELGRAREIAAGYKPGNAVRVLYDPEQPERAALRPGFVTWFDYVELILGLGFTQVCLLVGLVFLSGLTPSVQRRAEPEQATRELLRTILWEQPQPPRAVRVRDLIPVVYRPVTHVVCIGAAVVTTWLLLAPAAVLPHSWILIGIAVIGIAALGLWPLYSLYSTLWAVRYGLNANAYITEYWLNTWNNGSAAQVRWEVRSPAGDFVGRYNITGKGHQSLYQGSVVQVLVHPRRPKVLRIVSF